MSIIEEYTQHLLWNRGLSEKTSNEYRKDMLEIQKWLKAHTTVRRWSEVEKADVERYIADLSKAGLQAPTIRRRISCLRTFYQWAWQKGWTQENPAKYVNTPKLGKKLPCTLKDTVIADTIADATIDVETRKMVAVMAETGIRISELLNIRLNDIDRAAHAITIKGKGNKERRVYYGDMTAAAIATAATIGNGRLFNKGDRQARREIRNALGMHTSQSRCSSHTIRHTWACAMLNNGCDLKTISTLMGHSSVKTTEIYAQVAGQRVATQYKQYKPTYNERTEGKTAEVL